MNEDILPLETLERLSRQDGLDTRPILLRVLTDLFVQKPDRSSEEVARYEELASRLLEVVGLDARAAVARKLADDPGAPASLIERLIADDVAAAAPILARFPDVPRARLITLAREGGPVEASAIASRTDIDSELVRILVRHPDDLALESLVANQAARLADGPLAALVERAATSPGLATALLRRTDLDAAALAPLYLHADPTRRAEIREALASRSARSVFSQRPARGAELLAAAIEAAMKTEGSGESIAAALGEALSLRPDEAARLATEPSGEPFMLMLRAAGAEPDLATRALLLAQPDIAVSVHRVFALVDIAETTSRAVAGEIIAALTGRSDKAFAARHEPLFEPQGVMERAGSARPARRPTRRAGEFRVRGGG